MGEKCVEEAAAPEPDGGRKRQRDVHVEQWALVDGGSDPFQAPELRPVLLTGTCYNHPHVPNGELTSSELQMLDERQGIARSLNTQFTLGTPSPEFLEWLKRGNITRPYRYYNPAAEELSLSLHSEEDKHVAKEMRGRVHVAPKREALSDIKEDAEELQQESAGDGMDSAQRWLTADDWDELHRLSDVVDERGAVGCVDAPRPSAQGGAQGGVSRGPRQRGVGGARSLRRCVDVRCVCVCVCVCV